jgi:hypothetical protein
MYISVTRIHLHFNKFLNKIIIYINKRYFTNRGPLMVAQWLRYCATNRKVADSIPDGVIGIFLLT